MITLHHLNNSRSQRILWLLEEIGVEFEIKHYQRDSKTQLAPDALKKIHPLGKSPLLSDNGKIIAESAVIIDYLINKHATQMKISDPNSDDGIQYSYWMHFAEGSLMPPLLLRLVCEKVKASPMPFFIKPIAKGISEKVLRSFVTPNIKANINYIEKYLENKQWFVGEELTGADFQMSFPLEACVARGIVTKKYPNIVAYVKRFQHRPSYQRALLKAGDYAYA
jgi:glutathione S-transferase